MFYCINPGCCARNNHDNRRNCVACGTPLLIQSRYRLIHPMRHLERSRHFEVFEVSDTQGAHKILKVLKTNREELIQLFYREAEVLRWLDHPGIPSVAPDGYFPFPSEAEPRLHCLVMEKVDGINLEDWIKHHQLTSPSIVLKWMEELTQILEQIHKKNLFHRDIKPSNIICKPDGRLALIDFGSIKQNLQILHGLENTVVLTPGYAAPEQFERQAVPQSDFYCLGRTFAHLLTGKHPIDLQQCDDGLHWRQYLPSQMPFQLADLIDDLMHPLIVKRPKDTTELLQRIDHIFHALLVSPNPPSGMPLPTPPNRQQTNSLKFLLKNKKLRMAAVFSLAFIVFGIMQLIPKINQTTLITDGEATLFPGQVTSDKRKGMEAFAQKNYDAAIHHFKLSLNEANNPSDSEARIFLNNARIGNRRSYSIALSLPLDCSLMRVGQKSPKMTMGVTEASFRLLSGAQRSQEEINRRGGVNGVPLKLTIACANDPTIAEKTATEIVKRPEILGVIGTPSSRAAQVSERIYCGKIVTLSPDSSSEDLKNCAHSVFRLLPRIEVFGQTLSQYASNRLQRQRAVVFFNSHNLDSQALKNSFTQAYKERNGSVLQNIDLGDPKFNAKDSFNQVLKLGADVLVFFSDFRALDKSLQVVKVNAHRLPMIGSGAILNYRTLAIGNRSAMKLVVVTPCYIEGKEAQEWKPSLISDAVYTFATALRQTPTRLGVRETLMSPNFQTKGACGTIRFLPSGDRNSTVQLLMVLPGSQSGTGYDFVPIPGTSSDT